jgi:hypothetical protein
VIVIATNVSGGGENAKYTFAKDRNFYMILQTESVSNTLNISPGSLDTGNTWIYVKMKTSDSCYTIQTNIDSIKLVRSTNSGDGNSGGIVDPDYPNQLINAFPNPFHGQFSVSGFNSSKSYSLTVYNMQGKRIWSIYMSNQNRITIKPAVIKAGYILSIYDASKKRSLGILKLLNL